MIASYSDTYEVETSKVKLLYERELDDAKKLIEELAREKSRLEIEAEKANAEAQDALSKYVHIDHLMSRKTISSSRLDWLVKNGIYELLKVV